MKSKVKSICIFIHAGDLGDHVVVVNTKHISMPDRFWRGWRHFSHKGYAGSFKSERAWQVHRQDPREVLTCIYLTVYSWQWLNTKLLFCNTIYNTAIDLIFSCFLFVLLGRFLRFCLVVRWKPWSLHHIPSHFHNCWNSEGNPSF